MSNLNQYYMLLATINFLKKYGILTCKRKSMKLLGNCNIYVINIMLEL